MSIQREMSGREERLRNEREQRKKEMAARDAEAAAVAAAWRNVDVFNYHRPGASDVDGQHVLPKAVAVRVVPVETVVLMLVVSLCAEQLVCLYKHAVS